MNDKARTVKGKKAAVVMIIIRKTFDAGVYSLFKRDILLKGRVRLF